MRFWSGAFLGSGVALMAEHLYVHGSLFTLPPVTDHGLYGIVLVLLGAILALRPRR